LLQLLKLVPSNKRNLITTVTILTIVVGLLLQIYKSTTQSTNPLSSSHLLQYSSWWRGIEVCHKRALIETHWCGMTKIAWFYTIEMHIYESTHIAPLALLVERYNPCLLPTPNMRIVYMEGKFILYQIMFVCCTCEAFRACCILVYYWCNFFYENDI
jgi:hypothetical protein